MRVISGIAFAVVLSIASVAGAQEATEAIFDGNSATSAKGPNFKIALNEPYSPSFIKGRFGPFKVEFSDECEMECFVVSRGAFGLSIYGSEKTGKITALASWSEGARDARGNRAGTPLREALKSTTAKCEYAESLMCESAIKGLSYFITWDESCDWKTRWDKPSDEPVLVPACAMIDGFHVSLY